MRLRDADDAGGERELLNIFVSQGEELFDLRDDPGSVMLGSARLLADQPEFAGNNARIRDLLELTEERNTLRRGAGGAPPARAHDHHRRRERRSAAGRLHARHFFISRRATSAGSSASWDRPACRTTRSSSLVDHTSLLVEGLLA